MYPELGGCSLHDPLAVGIACDPSFATTLDIDMVVNSDKEKYGRTIGDTARLSDANPSVSVAIQVEKDRYLATFMEYLTTLFKNNK